ncbi:MAG TPA: ribonuclease P protein component [Candidatus Dormibacteraeota bacterium]|nr:ribonuclease P protein component [Candidatus Dormibacteraeota bacterium]
MKTKYRLRRPADFRAVRAERKGARNEFLRLLVRSNALGHPRVGIVVTRRLGGAVVRNRMRRRLQAQTATRLAALGPYDFVLFPQPAALTLAPDGLAGALDRALRQAGVAE